MIKMTLVGFGVELVQSGAGEAQAPAGQPAKKMSMVVAMLMMMVVIMMVIPAISDDMGSCTSNKSNKHSNQ